MILAPGYAELFKVSNHSFIVHLHARAVKRRCEENMTGMLLYIAIFASALREI